MQEKKLHKLGKTDLLTIIYEQEKKINELNNEITELKEKIEDKNLKIKEAGSIAEASLRLNEIFETAQKAADEYLNSIKEVNKPSQENAEKIKTETKDKTKQKNLKNQKGENTKVKRIKESKELVVINNGLSIIKPKLLKKILIFFSSMKRAFVEKTLKAFKQAKSRTKKVCRCFISNCKKIVSKLKRIPLHCVIVCKNIGKALKKIPASCYEKASNVNKKANKGKAKLKSSIHKKTSSLKEKLSNIKTSIKNKTKKISKFLKEKTLKTKKGIKTNTKKISNSLKKKYANFKEKLKNKQTKIANSLNKNKIDIKENSTKDSTNKNITDKTTKNTVEKLKAKIKKRFSKIKGKTKKRKEKKQQVRIKKQKQKIEKQKEKIKKNRINPEEIEISLEELEAELKRRNERKKKIIFLKTMGYASLVIVAGAIIISTTFFKILEVSGSSMEPSLYEGDLLITSKFFGYEKGDIIAFYYNDNVLIKRVIATEGDSVSIEYDGTVYVNSQKIEEDYVKELSLGNCDITFPYIVEEDCVFVLGDNRESSIDSRSEVIGCISEDKIIGKIQFKLNPFVIY